MVVLLLLLFLSIKMSGSVNTVTFLIVVPCTCAEHAYKCTSVQLHCAPSTNFNTRTHPAMALILCDEYYSVSLSLH